MSSGCPICGEQNCGCEIPGEESYEDYLEKKKMRELTAKTGLKPGKLAHKWVECMIKRENLQGQIGALEWVLRRNRLTTEVTGFRKDIQEMITLDKVYLLCLDKEMEKGKKHREGKK